jgi:hypothetical protein
MRRVTLALPLALAPVILLWGCNNCVLSVPEEDRKDFTAAVDDILAACTESLQYGGVVVGECSNNDTRLIFRFTGPFRQRFDYYDGETGVFTGREESQSDIPFPLPCLYTYWPAPVDCKEPTVTEVLCGNRYEFGGALLDLPFF